MKTALTLLLVVVAASAQATPRRRTWKLTIRDNATHQNQEFEYSDPGKIELVSPSGWKCVLDLKEAREDDSSYSQGAQVLCIGPGDVMIFSVADDVQHRQQHEKRVLGTAMLAIALPDSSGNYTSGQTYTLNAR